MFDYLLATLSISLTGFSACILLNSGLKYRKVENATLYFSLYYLLGFMGLVDMTLWFLEIINSKIFAIVWFWLGIFTGAIGWTFLTQFIHSEKLRKIVKFYVLSSITVILVLIAASGVNIIEAEILNTGTSPILFSLVMKSYIIIGGILMLLLMFTSAVKTRSKRISLFTTCLLVWTIADYLLLNHHAFALYLALYATVSLLLLISIKI
ncbi:MAG: hypothetical protein ACTSV7_13680 [Candidatus Baldrarchaeia archaeon]